MIALKESGRAYFGGYIEGDVKVNDFADYSDATGNLASTLSYPLARHIQRLNKIRAAVPALRKGQYSTEGCSGKMSFKRRYKDSKTDSYVLVTISGSSTFTGVLNGRYVDAVTGDVQNVTDGTLTATCSGKGNMRVYVLNGPGKIGEDGKYLYDGASVDQPWNEWPDETMPDETWTVKPNAGGGGGGEIVEPEEPIEPSMAEGEQAAFFENDANWGGTIKAWVWSDSKNYTGGKWPGQSATYLGNKVWKWTYTGTDKIPDGAKIIFSSDNKTGDMTWKNGGYYTSGSTTPVKVIEGAGEIPDDPNPPTPPTPGDGYTIFFDNSSSNWSAVYAYAYGGTGGNDFLGAWPGTQMTLDTELNLYKLVINTDKNLSDTNVIFSNKSGSQSGDGVTIKDMAIYNANGFTGNYVTSTAIDDVSASAISITARGGVLYVNSPVDGYITIVRADGMTTVRPIYTGVNTIDDLQRGFYIINRTKVIL